MKKNKHYDIRKIFEQMELDLISSMHRAFYFHSIEEEKEGFKFEQWQLTKLREIEKYRKRNKKLVDSYSKPIQEAIDRELRGSFKKGESKVTRFIDRVKRFFGWKSKKNTSKAFPKDINPEGNIREYIAKLLNRSIEAPPEENFFGVNEKKLEALVSTINDDLKKAQYSVLRKMDDVYRQTIFKSHMYLQNGTKTLNQAIDMATRDFLDKGINSIVYADGKRVNIASYAEMCLRTASHRATLLGEGKKRDEFGIHLVVVSAHANTCKMCAKWQGKVLIDDIFSHPTEEYIKEYSDRYKLLSEAVEKGLLHPNCRHTLTTYFEGITNIPNIPDEEQALKTYEAEQKQREYERALRKWKRIEAGTCDEESKIQAANKIRSLQNKLREHIKKNNQLRINNTRTEVKEFNPREHKEYLKKYDERVKISKRDGKTRAEEFSKYWEEASLKEAINKFTPDYEIIKRPNKGKLLYNSKKSNIQIVYDTNGDYFRIEDLSLKGKRRYLDMDGNNVTNKTENGKQKGRSKEEYEALTHFKNKDGDD